MGPALGVICGGTGVGEQMEMEVVVAMTAGLALEHSWRRGFGACCFEQALHGRRPSHINLRKFDWTRCTVN